MSAVHLHNLDPTATKVYSHPQDDARLHLVAASHDGSAIVSWIGTIPELRVLVDAFAAELDTHTATEHMMVLGEPI